MPGVMLIASLSGGGAVNTAWEAFEWRSISSAYVERPVPGDRTDRCSASP